MRKITAPFFCLKLLFFRGLTGVFLGVYEACNTTGRAAEFFGEKTMTTTIKALSASNDNLNKSSSKNLFKSLSRWMKISGISRSLYQLDDRTLNDIGICRGDIRAYAIRIVDNDNKTAA